MVQIGGQHWHLAGHRCEWPVAGGSQVTAEASRWQRRLHFSCHLDANGRPAQAKSEVRRE